MNYYVLVVTIILSIVSLIGIIESIGDAIHFFKIWRKTSPDSEMLSHGEHPGDEPIMRKSRDIQSGRFLGRFFLAILFLGVFIKSMEFSFYLIYG